MLHRARLPTLRLRTRACVKYAPLAPTHRYFPTLPTPALGKIVDLIASGLSSEADLLNADVEASESDALQDHRALLEIYGFLTQWAVTALEARAAEKSTITVAPVRGKGIKGKAKAAPAPKTWDSTTHLLAALETMCKVLKLKLLRVFVTTSERDTFVSLFTRPVYVVLESETRVKNTSIRMYLFKVLCIAIKHHGHAFGAQTSIVQNLTYFEHLSEPMAEFLQILSEQYDYPQLVDEILRELSAREYNSNDTRGPKSVSGFIIKLSEVAPRLVIKQMSALIKLLDSEVCVPIEHQFPELLIIDFFLQSSPTISVVPSLRSAATSSSTSRKKTSASTKRR